MMQVDRVTQTVVLASALIYVLLLFAIASYGDRGGQRGGNSRPGHTSTLSASPFTAHRGHFLGPLDSLQNAGWSIIAIYIGPILVFTFGYRFLRRIIRLAKSERITSIADMLAARYGKRFRCRFAGNMHRGAGGSSLHRHPAEGDFRLV